MRKILFIFVFIFVSILLLSCQTIKRLETRIDEVDKKNSDNSQKIENILRDLEDIKKSIAKIDTKIISLEESIRRNQSTDLRGVLEEIQKLQKKYTELSSSISSLYQDVETLKVRRTFKETRQLNEEYIKVETSKARDYIVQGKVDEAIKTLRNLKNENVENDEINFLLGDALFRKGDFEGAIRELSKVKSKELEPKALLRMSQAFLRLGDKTKSEITLKTLIIKYPNSPEAESAKKNLEEINKIR